MLLRNTTAVVIITLGCMTLGGWHERDNGKAGVENVGDFLKRESLKKRCETKFCFTIRGNPPNEKFS